LRHGGRSAYLAHQGAARVVGIDINRQEIELARKLLRSELPELEARVEYHVSPENAPLDLGPFDYVVLVDAMEHVVSPPAILRLAHRYVREGGDVYFSTVGWYHHDATHTGLLPWVQVLFSDETILNVIRWMVSQPDYRPSRFDSQPPVERWRGIYDLRDRPGEHLNKITIREIRRLVRHTVFSEATMRVLGFRKAHPLVPFLNVLRHVPLVQELVHSGIVVRLRK
jgi:SAM-dependent methyltransferase